MPAYFGLDIGFYSIKLIEAEKKGQEYVLSAIGEIRTPADINSEADKDKLALVEAIKKLTNDCKTTTKNVSLSLSEKEVYSQVIELPSLSERELASAIHFEAEQYIPVPLTEVQLEYIILKSPAKGTLNEKTKVLLVAAKKRSLDKMVEIVEKSGLVPVAVETETLSIIRSLNLDNSKTGLVLDLGHRSTDIFIVKEQNPQFIRPLDIGGETLTRVVGEALSMEVLQAEQYKIAYGLDESHLEGKVVKAILSIFGVVLEEIKKAITFFNQNQPEKKVEFIVLTGGGAEMPGLSAFLTKNLDLEIVIADPFFKFVKNERLSKIKDIPKWCIAAGLAAKNDE